MQKVSANLYTHTIHTGAQAEYGSVVRFIYADASMPALLVPSRKTCESCYACLYVLKCASHFIKMALSEAPLIQSAIVLS